MSMVSDFKNIERILVVFLGSGHGAPGSNLVISSLSNINHK